MAPRHSDVTGEARRQGRLRGETDGAAKGRGGKAQGGKQQRRRAIGRSGLADEKYKNSLGCPALGPALWGSEMTSRVSGTELAFIDEFRLLVQLQSLPRIESGE